MRQSEDSIDIRATLDAVYEEVMWLARRANVSPAAARSWYTHVASVRLRRHLRIFSGKVSRRALDATAVRRLEHFKRLQTTLTKLVADHISREVSDPHEFFRAVTECEQVHIVTVQENYDAMKAGGDYTKAGISLVDWADIGPEMQHELWAKMLRGRVANAQDFEPDHRPTALI